MTKEPEWAALPATTPPALRTLLRRCLDKDPKRRLLSGIAVADLMQRVFRAVAPELPLDRACLLAHARRGPQRDEERDQSDEPADEPAEKAAG